MTHPHGRPSETTPPPDLSTAQPQRILIVEDDADIRQLLVEVLSMAGYEVEEAPNGRVALERLQQRTKRPALLLLDLMMPEVSGWEVLEQLKLSRADRQMGVMVLSAVTDAATPEPRVRWLRKPIDPDDLLSAVRAALARR